MDEDQHVVVARANLESKNPVRKFAHVNFETDSLMLVQAIESSDSEINLAIEADLLFIKSLELSTPPGVFCT
ncbi:conserved hypothetical protein [Ricinus communis]|uniref:Uncharacterized protein n=1 Tax=Ricinus communis TaxID=3988 RepID=B9T184_RICCO|nr:conserved hypothetical protein [Ricinus communis]